MFHLIILYQERLSRPFKQDILTDLKSITDLCDCLAVVDITIGFLVSTGGDPDTNIVEYLAESGINLPKEQRSQITAKVWLFVVLTLYRWQKKYCLN